MSDKHALPLGHVRPWRRRILRAAPIGLLVLIAAGCWLAARAESARRQSEAAEAIMKCGCDVYVERPGKIHWKLPQGGEGFIDCSAYGCPWNCEPCRLPISFDYSVTSESGAKTVVPSVPESPAEPAIVQPPKTWPEALLGEHLGRRVISVEAPTERIAEIMPHLARLPYLKTVLVLEFDKSKNTETTAAIKRIKETLPRVDAVAVTVELRIAPDLAEAIVGKSGPIEDPMLEAFGASLNERGWLLVLDVLAWVL